MDKFEKKPILSISLLVSGREDTTEKCLNSLQDLRRQLNSELILVDTGCEDMFLRKIEKYADKVIRFAWCNDFAKARNSGLELATGEWFLFLDDDEWFEDVTPIVDFFQSGEYREYGQAVYLARNYQKKDGSTYSDDWVSRMIQLQEDTHFEGRVHESLVPTRGKCKRLPAFVHHYGYAFDTQEERYAHFSRNAAILEQLMREEPDNIRWWLQIVPEYIGIKDAYRLIEVAQEALEKIKLVDQPFMNQCRGAFYNAVLTGLAMEERDEELLQLCHIYEKDSRNTFAANAAICVHGMHAADRLQQSLYQDKQGDRNQRVAIWLEEMANQGKGYFAAFEKSQGVCLSEQEQIIEESIILVKEAFSEENRQEMRALYGLALAELGRGEEYPVWLSDEFGAFVFRQIENKGDFLMLPDDYWKLGAEGILPLEKVLLSLPLEQWMAQVAVLEQMKDVSLWDRLCERLAEIKTRTDIRYLYFEMEAAETRIRLDGFRVSDFLSLKSFEKKEQKSLRNRYVRVASKFAGWIYTDFVFEGDMALLPDNIRAAVQIYRKESQYIEKDNSEQR